MRTTEKIVGVIGGMGPEATVDLLRRIIRNTRALDDVDHIRCLVDNNPKVPSRIKALIEGSGESPGPAMAEMARGLEAWGANFLCIACNTAHAYFDDVQKAVGIPIVNMIEHAAHEALVLAAPSRVVGILASPAVRMTRLYSDMLERVGARAVYPDEEDEAALFALIKAIKAGHTGEKSRRELGRIGAGLAAKGVGAMVVACTELGVVMHERTLTVPVVDAAESLAMAVVRTAKGG